MSMEDRIVEDIDTVKNKLNLLESARYQIRQDIYKYERALVILKSKEESYELLAIRYNKNMQDLLVLQSAQEYLNEREINNG